MLPEAEKALKELAELHEAVEKRGSRLM